MVARPCVVHQDVDVAERVDGLGRHPRDIVGLGDVDRDGMEGMAGGRRFGDDLLVALGAAPGDGDLRAGFGQAEREGAAEALVATGHQRGAAREIERIRQGHEGFTIDLRLAGSVSLSRASATCSRS